MKNHYTYAVARVRSKELALLTNEDIQRLLNCKSFEDCLRILQDKGWETGNGSFSAEKILKEQQDQTFNFMKELVDDISIFDVFLYPSDYNNLKVAVKAVITDVDAENMFINSGSISPDLILKAIKEKDWSLLPTHMRTAAKDSFETLLHTADGQICDIIIDNALMEAMKTTAKESKNSFIEKYTELFIASANIKIAVRGKDKGKSLSFFKKAMVECDSLNVSLLAKAAAEGKDSIYEYLSITDYKDAIDEIKKSISSFEKFCENLVLELINQQKMDSFSIGPLAAYILARENERRVVRMILLAKINKLDNSFIQERIGSMYV